MKKWNKGRKKAKESIFLTTTATSNHHQDKYFIQKFVCSSSVSFWVQCQLLQHRQGQQQGQQQQQQQLLYKSKLVGGVTYKHYEKTGLSLNTLLSRFSKTLRMNQSKKEVFNLSSKSLLTRQISPITQAFKNTFEASTNQASSRLQNLDILVNPKLVVQRLGRIVLVK